LCGIAGIYIKDPRVVKKHVALESMANLLLLGIESRGKKATGFVSHLPGGKELTLDKQAVPASDFIKNRLPIPEGANVWLGHTRLDTQGDPKNNENNHPVVCNSTFVTHNGSIYNDDELFKEHTKGKREAEVDSQAIAMLLDKYGFEKAAEGLAQMRGAFAIASINPEKNPDEVLLAKGGWAPCVIHESDKFIIWASERSAIRDAWKVVLGTPPAWNSFKELHEGDIAVITKDGIEYRKFEAPPDFRTRQRRTTSGQRGNGGATGQGPTTIYRPTARPNRASERRLPPTRLSPGRHAEEVGKIRKEGHGTARLFEPYTEGKYDLKLFENADYPFQWEWCNGCLTTVLTDDMQDTVNWGYICNDCYDAEIGKLGYKDPPDPAGFLSEEDLNTLDNWATAETEVHKLALKEVQRATGMDKDTIDFLIFRCQESYFDKRPDMKQLADDLDEIYQEAVAQKWVDFGVGDAENLGPPAHVESDSGVGDGRLPYLAPGERPQESWGMQRRVQSPNWDPRAGAISHCTTHQTSFPAAQECHYCTRDFLRKGQPNLDLDQCRVCTRKQRPKFHILDWAWCRKHYITCNRCDDKAGVAAICTAPNGDRLCHQHSRGEKGLRYDTQLEKEGIHVAERVTP
jgi:hypothetical protein